MDRDPRSPQLSGSSEKDLQFRTMNISQKNTKRAKRIGEARENCPVLTKATLVRSRCFSNGMKPVPPNAQPRSDNSPSLVARPRLAGVPSRKLMAASRVEDSPNQGVTSDVNVVGQQLTYSNGPGEPEEDRLIVVSPPAGRPPGRVPHRVSRIPTFIPEPYQPQVSGKKGLLRMSQNSGREDSDMQFLSPTNPSDRERAPVHGGVDVPTKTSCPLCGHPSVERTFPTASGAAGVLCSQPACRNVDPNVGVSSTWSGRKESSLLCRSLCPSSQNTAGEAQGRTFPELLRASQMCSTTCRCVFNGIKPVPPISRGTKPLPDRAQGMPRNSGKAGQTGRPLERPMESNLQLYGEEEAVDYEERPNSLRFLQYTVAEEQDLLGSPPHNFLDGIKAGSDNSPPLVARPRLAGIPSRKLMAASRVEDSPNQGVTLDVSVVGQWLNYSNGPGEPEEDRLIVVSPPAATPPGRVPRRVSRIPRRVLGSSTRVASQQSLMSCPGQGASTGNTSVKPLARVYGQAVQHNSHPYVEETHKMGHVQDQWRSIGGVKKRLRMIGGDGTAEERDNISFPPLKSTPHIADELSPALKGKRRNGPENPGLKCFSRPELALTQSLQFLASDDWERKVEGLTCIRRLSQHHPAILISRLHDVSLALVQEVKNLRSVVSRMAVLCLGDMFSFLQRGMDPELGNTVKVLLHKAGESNTFIRQGVDSTLDCMVQSCTPARAVNSLLNGGLSHLNSRVRACMAHHLADLVERMGAHNLPRDLTDRILPAATRLAQDASQETRYKLALFLDGHFGKRLLSSLKHRL